MTSKAQRAMAAMDFKMLDFEFPEGKPLTVHLQDVCDRKVDEKYFLSDDKLRGFVSSDGPKGAYNGIVRAGTLTTVNGHDYIKRVYGLNGCAPTVPTSAGGGHIPKIEIPYWFTEGKQE